MKYILGVFNIILMLLQFSFSQTITEFGSSTIDEYAFCTTSDNSGFNYFGGVVGADTVVTKLDAQGNVVWSRKFSESANHSVHISSI